MDGYKVDQQVFDMKHAENLANFDSKKEIITEYLMARFYIFISEWLISCLVNA